MSDTVNRITELEDGESFAHYEMRVLRRRIDSLLDYVDAAVPAPMLATSAALVISSLICAFGPDALTEFARIFIVDSAKTELAFCPFHDSDDTDPKHRITTPSRFMCDECWSGNEKARSAEESQT